MTMRINLTKNYADYNNYRSVLSFFGLVRTGGGGGVGRGGRLIPTKNNSNDSCLNMCNCAQVKKAKKKAEYQY